MMLVLKAGKQVAFGTAQDMLEAVRRLQVVAGQEAGQEPTQAAAQAPVVDTEPPLIAAAGGAT